ncbi:hypothetical protein SO802_012347 [Lithocarpus litseifolius]|uniref:Uncharacterized protein n=1 Tax=Lithocarpus litseifolius TaxID=425828 RepID=A0AAW2D6F2_9ROSI
MHRCFNYLSGCRESEQHIKDCSCGICCLCCTNSLHLHLRLFESEQPKGESSRKWTVLSGGLLGFVFSRNLATLSTGVLFGGALLALSTFSLKIWRQGKSSLPFILGQAGSDLSVTSVQF